MTIPFLRFEGPFHGRYSYMNPWLLVKVNFRLSLQLLCMGGIFPPKQKPPHDLWASSVHHIWEEEFPILPTATWVPVCLRLSVTSEGAWKKNGWFLHSLLTVAWWPSILSILFCIFYTKYPKLLAVLKSFLSARSTSWTSTGCVSGCMVSSLCSSLCAIDKVSHSHSAGATISSWCHEHIYKCKLLLYFPFWHSDYQMHQIHSEFENKKRKKTKTKQEKQR